MENPKIIAFLPLFYLAWSDDVLTAKEFATLQQFVFSQVWLSEKEKQLLLSKIDLASPHQGQHL